MHIFNWKSYFSLSSGSLNIFFLIFIVILCSGIKIGHLKSNCVSRIKISSGVPLSILANIGPPWARGQELNSCYLWVSSNVKIDIVLFIFQVLGSVGALPDILIELEVSYYLLRRLLGVRIEGDKKAAKVQKLSKNEVLMVNIGSLSTGGRVIAVKADLAKIGLTTPVCTSVGEKIALSRRVEKHWRLIGWGQIRNGVKVTPTKA